MVKIKHKVTIDILNLQTNIFGQIMTLEGQGFRVSGIVINPKTFHDVVVDEDYRVFSLYDRKQLFGVKVFISTEIDEMEYKLVIE